MANSTAKKEANFTFPALKSEIEVAHEMAEFASTSFGEGRLLRKHPFVFPEGLDHQFISLPEQVAQVSFSHQFPWEGLHDKIIVVFAFDHLIEGLLPWERDVLEIFFQEIVHKHPLKRLALEERMMVPVYFDLGTDAGAQSLQ